MGEVSGPRPDTKPFEADYKGGVRRRFSFDRPINDILLSPVFLIHYIFEPPLRDGPVGPVPRQGGVATNTVTLFSGARGNDFAWHTLREHPFSSLI